MATPRVKPEDRKPMGRKALLTPKHLPLIKAAYEQGMTDGEVAALLRVSMDTIQRYRQRDPDLCGTIKVAKQIADDRVERSLYERAVGYSHPDAKIFDHGPGKAPLIVDTIRYYPPDTAAAFIWLKNRRAHEWRDHHEVDHTITQHTRVELELMSDDDLYRLAQRAIARAVGGGSGETPALTQGVSEGDPDLCPDD